jgi:hypothetical protein
MANPRFTGLLLLLTGVLVLMGNTMDVLPAEAFWAGLLTYPIGGYLFFMGSRQAIEAAEARHARNLNPHISNRAGEDHARRQERSSPNPNAAPSESETAEVEAPERESRIVASLRKPADDTPAEEAPAAAPLALHDIDEDTTEDLEVTTDVSYPVEVQERQNLAEQLEKLSRLQQQGIISAEEYAVAKAKLLG